jgi:hypothetical protein
MPDLAAGANSTSFIYYSARVYVKSFLSIQFDS